MKFKIVSFFILILYVSGYLAVEFKTCDITSDDPNLVVDFDASTLRIVKDDVIEDTDTLNVYFTTSGKLSMNLPENESAEPYLNVTLAGDKLSFKTTDQFKKFDQDQVNNNAIDGGAILIQRTVDLTCDTEGTIHFIVKLYVKDTNNNPPVFTTTEYTYKIPMPLVPKVDLTSLGDEIIVTDYDFTETTINFTVDNPKFTVETKPLPARQYRAVLKILEFTSFNEDLTLKITATDSQGKDHHNENATITITKDKESSLPNPPTFSKSIYKFEYNDNGALTGNDNITITTSDAENTKVELSSNTYFEAKLNDNTVTISRTDTPIETVSESVIALTLTITLDGDSSEATIIISFPSDIVVTVPKFSNAYYTATYSTDTDPHTVTLDKGQYISVTPKNAEVALDGEYAGNFTIELEKEVWVLALKGNLDDTVLKNGDDIVLKLKASITGEDKQSYEGFSAIVVKLPKSLEAPRFKQAPYIATYTVSTEDGKPDTAKLDNGPILVVPATEGVDVTIIQSEYSEYFKLDGDATKGWGLALNDTNLKPEVVEKTSYITLTLSATLKGDEVDSGTIVVNLPGPNADKGPSFEKTYYTATYKVATAEEANDKIEVTNGPISLKNVDGNVEVSFDKTEQYSDAFEIIHNKNNTYSVNVTNGHNIDDKILIDRVDIVLTLKATVDELVGEATLVIQLPKEVAPASFNKSVYVGTYDRNADSKLSLEDIELTGNYLAETKVDLATPDELKNYFTLDGKNPYNIKLNGLLPDSYLNEHHEIVLTLIAQLNGTTLKTSATIVIEITDLPKAPKFSKPVYRGKYEVVENKGKVSLSDNIETDATDPSLVHFTIESNYRNNFNITYDETSKQYKVEVSKLLEDTTEPEISVIMDATIDGAPDANSASLLLTMPEKISDIVPEFSDIVYEAMYSITGNNQLDTITLLKPIEIISDQAKATKVEIIDQYKSNFNINESLQINVIKNLDLTILQQKDIVISLHATLKDSKYVGIATVLLAWEEQSFKRAPKFSKPFYTADYTVSNVLENVEPIVIENIDHGFEKVVNVTVEDQYKSLISILYNETENKWIASIQQPLDLANLDSEVLIKLTAHLDGSVDDDTATLAISLPTVTFGKAYYSFTYKQNSGKDDDELIDDNSDITVTEGVNVSIPADSSEYSNHFGISCVNAQCVLNLNGDLTDDILKKESEIILTLEAKLGAATGQATVIISLPLQEKAKAPIFTETVYIGSYQDGEPIVRVDHQIKIDGVDNVNDITLTFEKGDYTKYFGLKPMTDHWEVTTTLKQDDIKNIVLIPLTLLATKDGVTEPGRSSLVIQLPTDTSNATFHFAASVYKADYKDDQLNIKDIITIEGDEDSSAEVTLDGDPAYKSYFSASYDEKTVHITLTDDKLPPKILNKYSVLYLTIKAVKDDNTQTAALVVTLPKTDSGLQFDKVTYVATYYQHDESKDEISADPIKIIGVDDPKTVNVAIKESSTEISLDVTFDQGKSQWTISLKDNLPQKTIDAEVSILITLEATTSEGATADAGMIVMLPKKVVPANFSFKKPYYNADYTITDSSTSNLTISDEIVIEGTTDNINVKLDGEYKDYLSVKTTPKEGIMEVAITLKEAFNETIVDENAAIAVDIVATKDEQIATAPLVITLPKKTISGDDDSEDKTGLIAAVAVLAVLLVASLVGSAVFYYFKFKKGSNYNNMDDAPRLSDRFRKNSNTTDSKYKFEHPTRRPTGVIKLPLNDEVVGETATDEVVVPSEKRKSVQFDTININELEIEKSEEDVDDIGEEEEDKDDDEDSEEMAEENDERRASHV